MSVTVLFSESSGLYSVLLINVPTIYNQFTDKSRFPPTETLFLSTKVCES